LGGLGIDDYAVAGEWLRLGKKPLLHVVLGECPLRFGVFQNIAHFVEGAEVVLDVLNGAVFREFVQKGFNLLFGTGHCGFVADIRLCGLAPAALTSRMSHPLRKAQKMGRPPARDDMVLQ
jgi:hypothetical protein